VLSALGMLDDEESPAPPPQLWLHGDGDADAFSPTPVDGWFVSKVRLLDVVSAGQLLGRVVDRYGQSLHDVLATAGGIVATLRTSAPVTAGTPLIGLAEARPALLGLPSDAIVRNGEARP
jgi:predicted deacylase